MKIVAWFIEMVFWIAIFSSPVLAFGLIALVVYAYTGRLFPFPAAVLILGVVSGVICAERIRKKYGCSTFMSRLYGSGKVNEENID